MRLLVVTPFYKPAYVYGGPTRSIPTLCEGLAQLGLDVTVLTTNANGPGLASLGVSGAREVDGVKVHYFTRDIAGSYFYSRTLSNACRRYAAMSDAVYVSSTWAYPFLPASASAKRSHLPYVISPRTAFMRKTWQGKHLKKAMYHFAMERWLINGAAVIHYTSELERDESAWLKLRATNVVVPNPIALAEFATLPLKGRFRQKWRIPAGSKVALFLGRVEPRKGIDITIRAFVNVMRALPEAHLVIAGPEEDGHLVQLRSVAEQLGVVSAITFTGYLGVSERLEALVDSDTFVLSSHSENFGMVVVEAMACGLPVVVSDHVGLADAVVSANAGVVTDLDPANVAAALIQVLSNPEHADRMGRSGKALVHRLFAPEAVARTMLSEFERIVATSRRH